MRLGVKSLIVTLVAGQLFWALPAFAGATGDDRDTVTPVERIGPPSRPLEFTAEQSAALERLSQQGDHDRVASVRASYSPEGQRALVEFGVIGTQAVIPTAVLILLFAAAPL